ncbi:hypothetical protein KVV02_005565, partial [Mortierella alpina]
LLNAKELSQKSISVLVSKRFWKTPKDKTRDELQMEAYEEILKRELSKKTLPNGIVDRAAKIIYGVSAAITSSMKTTYSHVGQRNDCNFGMTSSGNDPGSDGGPSPDSQIVDTQTLNDISTLANEPEEDESQFRICTAKFNRIIRKEQVAAKNDELILEEIQRVQREMAPVVSDAFTVAASGAYRNDDERPPQDQFQLSALVPKAFQRQVFQSTLNVAAITKGLQDSIEENASLPRTLQDERFRILSSEYIK